MTTQQNQQAQQAQNVTTPMVPPNTKTEPMLLLDTTGSMNERVHPDSPVTRRELVGEALGTLVAALGAADSEAAFEKEEGKDAGGLMTITFAGGRGICIDDLSVQNWREKYDQIRWEGGTQIMPGWNTLVETYVDEFSHLPVDRRPAILALILTDGEARDIDEFAGMLAKMRGTTYAVIGLFGYGAEHDKALDSWRQVAKDNNHVRVLTFAGNTDPNDIASTLLTIIK